MSLLEIIAGSSSILLVLLTLVQVSPIKVDPWSSIGKALGKVINGDVISKLEQMEAVQAATRKRLDDHIRVDDERNADLHRVRILQFNTELLRDIRHTEEDFNDILSNIDYYERYCSEHPEYQNNRAVHAIMNIKRVYDERMEKHDFL